MKGLPFDTILVGDEKRPLSVEQFLRLPLNERIALILDRKLSFREGEQPVDRALALKKLMEAFKRG